MNAWRSYDSRLSVRGATKRDVVLNREKAYLRRKLPSSLSYHKTIMNDVERELAIINSDNLHQKTVCSMPGENITSGSLVQWCGRHWLVTDVDPNNEVYTRGIMLECNHLLRWIAADGTIVERWCIVSDGTKYLTGETISSYDKNGMSLGDTRIAVSIARDEYTLQLNRDHRFLIDDEESETVLAYRLTKPYKIGGVYGGEGVMTFMMTEVNTEDDDNFELRIADYYTHFPRPGADAVTQAKPSTSVTTTGRRNWL